MVYTTQATFSGVSLDAAGLVALADLSSIATRTAIVGSASALDSLFLAPGIHRQQFTAEVINNGEQPATAALTTEYVFRIENQATVSFLQRVGVTGHLVNLKVERDKTHRLFDRYCFKGGVWSSILYLLGPVLTVVSLAVLGALGDWWGLGSVSALVIARLINVVVMRRRSKLGWKGLEEPGEIGDLLVLVSQDRWIRMQGLVNDLKTVTAGSWLRNTTSMEGFAVALATLIVYATAALAGNATRIGSLILLGLLLCSAALLGLSNEVATHMHMHGCRISIVGEKKAYERRLDMALELIHETGREDWAIGLGMINTRAGSAARRGEKVGEKVEVRACVL